MVGAALTLDDDSRPGLRWKVTKAVRASRMPSPAKLVMLTLADIADVGTAEIPAHWTPSLTVLARETNLGRSTVAEHLASLEKDGWVVRTRPDTAEALGRGERTRYRLCVPDHLVQDVDQVVQEPDALVQESDGASPVAGHPSPVAGHRIRSSSDLDQISSDPPSPPSKEVAIPERQDVERVCAYLAEWIVKNGSKRPTITKKWRTEARLLIDKDGKPLDEIRDVIAWSQRDTFWCSNILSMPKLREKYDQLRLAMQRVNGTNGHAKPSTTDQRVNQGLALAAKYAAEEAS